MRSHSPDVAAADATTTRPAVACRGLCVEYGGRRVLSDVSFDLRPDQVLVVLGPSGSGKTTLLYALAGFVAPSAGTIAMAGEVVAGPNHRQPPEKRRIGMVFQHYALWPHLTVVDIVAYPARRAGLGREAARVRALELLERLHIAQLAARRPAELSGGEQQRVGLARALAGTPLLYLFDEPTAHLDAGLRAVLRDEIARRRAESAAAAIYATHDAQEALAIADRIALLREGRLLQIGTPTQIYEQPPDLWAARLTGPASVLTARLAAASGSDVRLVVAGSRTGGLVEIAADAGVPADQPPGAEVIALVRPDWVVCTEPVAGAPTGAVVGVRYEGPHTDTTLATPAGQLLVREPGPPRHHVGDEVGWRPARIWLLPQRPTPAQPAGLDAQPRGS